MDIARASKGRRESHMLLYRLQGFEAFRRLVIAKVDIKEECQHFQDSGRARENSQFRRKPISIRKMHPATEKVTHRR